MVVTSLSPGPHCVSLAPRIQSECAVYLLFGLLFIQLVQASGTTLGAVKTYMPSSISSILVGLLNC